ncbi:MAG: 16S rRNA (cytosine(967)-C(5))-methyltransferase RsmB [Caldimonas sp.]
MTSALALATLLGHTADAVAAVRAGRSLDDALARCPLPARPGTQALAFHALRWLGAAEAARAALAPKRPPPEVDALLLTALALLWPPGEPPYAEHTLVDQAVAAAKVRSPRSASFVNAVLRRFVREREALVATLLRQPTARFNHPAWWLDRLRADWPDDWRAIADADNLHPPMTLRVNVRRSSPEAYVRRLVEAGIGGRVAGAAAVVLDTPCPVTALPGFADGEVSVQDAAAQLAAPLLLGTTPAAGMRVLDACAAPGGKTAHLLELAELDLVAVDRDAARLVRVDETLARLGLHATTLAADAAEPASWWDGRAFDAILLDAPCSASGIVRRHPDVRWLRRASDIASLAERQSRLLKALWPLLASGGHLLYCTCSVFRAEGQDRIDAFLQRHGDAALAADRASPGHLLPLPDNAGTPVAPGTSGAADGFFYALLHRR